MPQSSVSRSQRFTKSNPCPICAGYDRMPRGKGERCYGFLGSDGAYCHCTRVEYANGLPEEAGGSYAHRLTGSCKCGRTHGEMPASPAPTTTSNAKSEPKGKVVAIYDYVDEQGVLLGQVLRKEPKSFTQRRPGPGGGWVYKAPERKVPFHLPQLLEADPEAWVFIVEGEEDVLALESIGLVATCNMMGAGKDLLPYTEFFRDRNVAIIPDNDDPGRTHADAWQEVLRDVTKTTVQVHLAPESGSGTTSGSVSVPSGFDPRDWVNRGGYAETLIDQANEDETRNQNTRKLHILRYATLLDDVEAFLAHYVIYPSEYARVAHVLWIAHTWFMDAWESTPRLAFLSPEPQSGKTRAMEVSRMLCQRAVLSSNSSAAYMFRKIAQPAGRPTLLFDEIDAVFKDKTPGSEDKRSIINAGYRAGEASYVGRCDSAENGHEAKEYETYCPVALAGLGSLPETISSRAVIIHMQRRKPGEKIADFRLRFYTPKAKALHQRLSDCSYYLSKVIARHIPEMPVTVRDRDADIWEPLVTIADIAGGHWPNRARSAAVAMVAQTKDSPASINIQLLADVRTVFGDLEKMSMADICNGLQDLEDTPWAEWNKFGEHALTTRQLGKRIGEFGLKSTPLRVPGQTRARGYFRTEIEELWDRYLPKEPGDASPTPQYPINSGVLVPSAQPGQKTGTEGGTEEPESSSFSPNGATDHDPAPY